MRTEKRKKPKIAEPKSQTENLTSERSQGPASFDGSQIKNRHALSGWPMIIAWIGMLIFALHACTHMVAAGDTWVAMACGRHFVNRAKAMKSILPFYVDTNEPFSANSHKPGPTPEEIKTWPNWAQWITDKVGLETVKYWHPTGWVNQNWLTHVIFYSLVPKSSYADGLHFSSNALVYWKFAIYIITIVCVYYTGVKLGVNPALSAAFSCFAMFVGRSFLDVRPAGFSNMLVAVFLLVLVLTTYRNILYIWLLVPIAVFWCNVHGGYIYAFIMLVPFVGLHLLTVCDKKWTAILYNVTAWPFFYFVASRTVEQTAEAGPTTLSGPTLSIAILLVVLIVLDFLLIFFKKNLASIGWKGIFHTIGAGFVAFLAVIVFNPFHLTNLTHTFIISVSKDAERWRDVHEWHPAFAWDNPVGTAVPFLVMYIIVWVVLAVWVVVLISAFRPIGQLQKRKATAAEEYQRPKIDLPLLLIAGLTIYMAICSRRFIPIAAIAACPVIAMLIDQIVRAISATLNFRRNNRLSVSSMPADLQLTLALGGVAAVLFFGIWWGLKFKRVYLDPWPPDTELTSVFMRMTASDAKPFYACKFIKDNKLKGKMFNYWTEGGFIAWGQEPDPNTGHTPLKLFMDGRAQAAYNVPTFDLWTVIMTGGPTVQITLQRARAMGQEMRLTADDYRSIGAWMDQQLKRYNVWVVLMPAAQFDTPSVKGLEYNPFWRVVLINNKSEMFVDINTPSGRELYDGIFTGKTLFPDEFCRSVTIAHNLLSFGREVEQGLDFAIDAYNINPSPAPMIEIVLLAARFGELKSRIDDFCKKVVDDFVKNRDQYTKENGYRLRIEAVRLACMHSERVARAEKNTELEKFYDDEIAKCEKERNRLSDEQRW
jgi:hypothetical protein